MSGPDHEFEEFLKRRRPVFRDADDGLEPPPELDRVVLRRAREAIEADRPLRMFAMPRWAAPVSIAATLVLGLSIVFRAGMPTEHRVPQVTVENVAQRHVYPAPEPEAAATSQGVQSVPEAANYGQTEGTVVVDLANSRVARNERPRAPPADTRADTATAEAASPRRATRDATSGTVAAAPAAEVATAAPWRSDAKAWLAEIERLRTVGESARADVEQAEYNRQQRAYAVAPDR